MISQYIREQKRYTQKQLCQLLHLSEERVIPVIRKLKEYGVLKTVTRSLPQKDLTLLNDQDVEITSVEQGENDYYYVFTFVGVLIISGCVIKCYPKYILSNHEPKHELQQVLKVLERYNTKEQVIHISINSDEGQSFNLLAVLLFLLNDYYEFGLYSNTEDIVEVNGNGEIHWEKTINDSFAIFHNNRPYYGELKTKKRVEDEYNYFKRLHECIVTKASRELQKADLLDLFEINGVDISDDEIDSFGEKDYILYRLENELNVQFNTRKQILLKTMYAYIAYDGDLRELDCFSVFGTISFNLVWEDVCSCVLNNQLNMRLKDLELPVRLNEKYNANDRLIDLIGKPFWTATNKTAADTLIPDLVTINNNNGVHQFLIFDAKYYVAILEEDRSPHGQPGIESVTKQYLYQLAFMDFINEHSINNVTNCFLLPTEQSNVMDKGEVKLQMLHNLGLQNILVRFVPASMFYEHYLSGKKVNVNRIL